MKIWPTVTVKMEVTDWLDQIDDKDREKVWEAICDQIQGAACRIVYECDLINVSYEVEKD